MHDWTIDLGILNRRRASITVHFLRWHHHVVGELRIVHIGTRPTAIAQHARGQVARILEIPRIQVVRPRLALVAAALVTVRRIRVRMVMPWGNGGRRGRRVRLDILMIVSWHFGFRDHRPR